MLRSSFGRYGQGMFRTQTGRLLMGPSQVSHDCSWNDATESSSTQDWSSSGISIVEIYQARDAFLSSSTGLLHWHHGDPYVGARSSLEDAPHSTLQLCNTSTMVNQLDIINLSEPETAGLPDKASAVLPNNAAIDTTIYQASPPPLHTSIPTSSRRFLYNDRISLFSISSKPRPIRKAHLSIWTRPARCGRSERGHRAPIYIKKPHKLGLISCL